MNGKEKCRILKDIRAQIAKDNDIEWIVSECKHQGNCLGTCPKCEAELRKLERELEHKRNLGHVVTVAGLSFMLAGCNFGIQQEPNPDLIEGDVEIREDIDGGIEDVPDEDEEIEELAGDVSYIDEE